MDELIQDKFVIYKPKDIVAGDFYWVKNQDKKLFVGVCDCTGHGVPGAMVSVICNGALNRSVEEFGLHDPGSILDKTRELIVREFEKSNDLVQDGMDAAIITIHGKNVSFSGANNPLWIIRGKTKSLEEIKGNNQAVGSTHNPQPFSTHSIKLESGDTLYMFTDGITDQFGGPSGKKYGKKAFKELLLSVVDMPVPDQKKRIEQTLIEWMGNLVQIDDICLIGIKF